MMDANTRIDAPELLCFCQTNDLTDLMQDFLPTRRPPTHQRGQHQIDCILGSTALLPFISAAFIMDFDVGPTSDHCILIADLNITSLIPQETISMLDPTSPGHCQL
jgi:hypothetical protein